MSTAIDAVAALVLLIEQLWFPGPAGPGAGTAGRCHLSLRADVYDRDPSITTVFAPITAALTNEVMAELNRQRSAEGRSARRVARTWLAAQGFITE